MYQTAPLLSGKAIVISAVPYDAAKAHSSGDKAKWEEFIAKHAGPLRNDLLERLPESLRDPGTEVYRKGTPISGSLVSLHWFELDIRHAFAEVLRHQLSDAVVNGTPGDGSGQYDRMKDIFRASIKLFWEQASWVALHMGTKRETDFPFESADDGYFDIVDSYLADLMFERAFCRMCADQSDPHHAALKEAYEAKFAKPLDVTKLSGLDRDLAKLTPEFVNLCIDFWKLGGYTAVDYASDL